MIGNFTVLKIILILAVLYFIQPLPAFSGEGEEILPAVKIIKFVPPSGEYRNGDTVYSSLGFKNEGSSQVRIWAGYSVCDAGKNWHDAPFFGPVNLAAGEVSALITLAWKVPDDGSFTGGRFGVRMALWDAPPGGGGSNRLDFIDRAGAFYGFNDIIEKQIILSALAFKSIPDCVKPAGNRGRLLWKNAASGGDSGSVSLILRKDSFDGAEIFSEQTFSYGRFEAVFKTPAVLTAQDANSFGGENNYAGEGFTLKAVTGFFLFEPVSEDEITIEIFNDGSRRVWFSAFIGGKQSAHAESVLEFDPAEGFHSYAINYSDDGVEFFIDAKRAAVFVNDGVGLKSPRNDKMKIYFNSWFPSWKEFQPFYLSDTPRGNYITSIKEVKYSRGGLKSEGE